MTHGKKHSRMRRDRCIAWYFLFVRRFKVVTIKATRKAEVVTSPNDSQRDQHDLGSRVFGRAIVHFRDVSDSHQWILSGSAVSCGTSTYPNCGINISAFLKPGPEQYCWWDRRLHLAVQAVDITIGVHNISSSFVRSHYSPYTMLKAGPQQAGIEANRKQEIVFLFIITLYHYPSLMNPFYEIETLHCTWLETRGVLIFKHNMFLSRIIYKQAAIKTLWPSSCSIVERTK